MDKNRAIVDTCFLQKITAEGKYPDNLKILLNGMNYTLIAHPYVVTHEFSLHNHLSRYLDDCVIQTVSYEEFLPDESSKILYESQFNQIYNELKSYLDAMGGKKRMPELILPKGRDIYSGHLSGSSMGDVHMILMASFMRVPLFLTEDSDIAMLRDITNRRFSLGEYHLEIYNTLDMVKRLASDKTTVITHSELKTLTNQIGERKNWSKVNTIWNENHPTT